MENKEYEELKSYFKTLSDIAYIQGYRSALYDYNIIDFYQYHELKKYMSIGQINK